ncbi:transposase [Yinghuangia aomiensis]
MTPEGREGREGREGWEDPEGSAGPGIPDSPDTPGDLTDAQWHLIRALLPPPDHRGAAPPTTAACWTASATANAPAPPGATSPHATAAGETLYGRHRKWAADGTWSRVGEVLAERG